MIRSIRSIRDRRVQQILDGVRPKGFSPDLLRATEKRLTALELAEHVTDLAVPPSMRLEKLAGDREGSWSIRINRQWRICFRWQKDGAYDVEIVDYH
jgi:proteic killer suppression protein